jgi:low affinity Fe/Cu permease
MGNAEGTISKNLEVLSGAVTTNCAGGTAGFASALAVIVVWAMLGPVFRYSDTWQLVINTAPPSSPF